MLTIDAKSKNFPNLTLTIFIATIIVWYLYYRYKHRRYYKLVKQFTGIPSYPIIGTTYMFFGSREKIYRNFMKTKGVWLQPKPARYYVGPIFGVAIAKPHHAEIVLNNVNALEKLSIYKFAKPWIGNGLITAPVSIWKKNRKKFLPTFNKRILDSFVEIFNEKSEILVRNLQKEVGRGCFDIMSYVMNCTLDDICETTIGVKVGAQEGKSDYVSYSRRIIKIIHQRGYSIWLYPDCTFYWSNIGKEFKECIHYLKKFSSDIIKEKRKEKQIKQTDDKSNGEEEFTKRKPYLEHLMDYTDLTNDEIQDEVNSISIAGNETTGTTTCFVLLALAMFPEIQEKVYQEICSVLDNSQRPIEKTDLPKLKYLEMVIKETLRLFPTVPVIARQFTEEIELDNCTLPKGSSAGIWIYLLHRDPEYWPDPDKFDPERFQPTEIAKRHPYSFLPFSGGPRNCIGLKYAYMVIKCTVANIIKTYKLSTDVTMDNIVLTMDVTLSCLSGYRMKIDLRNCRQAQ